MYTVFIYDAFTAEKFGGNPAGVVFCDKFLEKNEKQKLAKELHFSETVFITESKEADWKLEYFTPKQEVDLCGHATIAAIYALFEENKLQPSNTVKIETNLGIFDILLKKDRTKLLSVWMEQDQGKASGSFSPFREEISEALGIEKSEIREDINIVKAYSGLWDLLIPIASKESLDNIVINIAKVEELSRRFDVISFHPFYLEKGKAFVRNFAPIVEIPEEAATGTSNGALAFYLHQIKQLKTEEELLCLQGESMGRNSEILSKITQEGKILVGGKAVRILKGEYTL